MIFLRILVFLTGVVSLLYVLSAIHVISEYNMYGIPRRYFYLLCAILAYGFIAVAVTLGIGAW